MTEEEKVVQENQEQEAPKVPTPEEVLARLTAKAPEAAKAPKEQEQQPAEQPAEEDVDYGKLTTGVQKRIDTLSARAHIERQGREKAEGQIRLLQQQLAHQNTQNLPEPRKTESPGVDTDTFFGGLVQDEPKSGGLPQLTEEQLEDLPPIVQQAVRLTFKNEEEKQQLAVEQDLESQVQELASIVAAQKARFPEFADKDIADSVVQDAFKKGVPFSALPQIFEARHLKTIEDENTALKAKLGIKSVASQVPSGGPPVPPVQKEKVPTPEEVLARLRRERGES
jgi:hypothetical protein